MLPLRSGLGKHEAVIAVRRATGRFGTRFSTTRNIPLDPPIPPARPCSRSRKGERLSQGRSPLGAQRFPSRRQGGRGEPAWRV
jgi:hypothetical protein